MHNSTDSGLSNHQKSRCKKTQGNTIVGRFLQSKQQEALVSLWIQIKQSSYVLRTISTFNGKPLKFVNQLTYLSINISTTESDVNILIARAWTVIDRLSIIWKSNLSAMIKQDFFQSVPVSVLQYECTTWMQMRKS